MKRFFYLIFLLASFYSVSANNTGGAVPGHGIQQNIEKINRIMKSRDWVPADSSIDHLLEALIGYLENRPVDSVITGVNRLLNEKEILFVRDYQKIKNPEEVKGFVPQREINGKIEKIAKVIPTQYPASEIPVPEELFTGGYANLGLIGEDEVERMIIDSIYVFPDSIMALINETPDDNDSLKNQLDSLCTHLVNDARISYNESLITRFRDSITRQYRKNHIQSLIENEQRNYLDSVTSINNKIIERYNDDETRRVNKELKQEVQTLVSWLNQQPNEITIVNMQNEPATFRLQNGGEWHRWLWLKNAQNDSIGIRIENLDKQSIRMLVDESVNLSRLTTKDRLEVGEITPMQQKEPILSNFTTRKPILSPWKLIGKAYAGFTQTYINPFWSQGGKSSASALTTFNYAVNYAKEKVIWESFADMKLGVIYYLPEDGVVNDRNWHKNSDSFEINSRLGFSAFKKWYYSAEANFKTQSFYGYKNQNDTVPTSAFLSPAYLTFSAGMEYKPGKEFSAFLSPLSLKTTYVTNPLVDETRFGLPKGETSKSRVGISGKIDYSRSLLENVSLKTKNSIFINFGNNTAGDWQFLKFPDFDSETAVDFKVNQFITTQVNVHLIYDKDVESTWMLASGDEMTGTRLQVKEFFTLGISYKF